MPYIDPEIRKKYGRDWRRQHRKQNAEAAKKYRKRKQAALREHVAAKTQGRCHLCSRKLGKNWQVDHRIPVSKGGTDDLDNLWPACARCNNAANNHHETDEEAGEFPYGENAVAFDDDYARLAAIERKED